jgi:DNA ligase-1
MQKFCDLYWKLDGTTKTLEKVDALEAYFSAADPEDAIWAIYFLVGQRIKRLVSTKLLRKWAVESAGIADWLFAECYDRVGDLAETISLIVPPADNPVDVTLKELIERMLIPIADLDEDRQRQRVIELWDRFDAKSIFVLGKLMTGGFRVGVSKKLVIRALAKYSHVDAATIAHRLMGDWAPEASFYAKLVDPNEDETAISRPYPFFLANPIKDQAPGLLLGQPDQWIAEWKWDGIRSQVIRRSGETFIWSRGEDLITHQFPEIASTAGHLPDGTVLDGEIVGWDYGRNRPLEFNQLQRRLGRKKVGKKLLTEVPVVMLAFDLIEHQSADIRSTPLIERREILGRVLEDLDPLGKMKSEQGETKLFGDTDRQPVTAIFRPPEVPSPHSKSGSEMTWDFLQLQRQDAKAWRSEGLMLKKKDSAYQVGRPVGDWWKWKVDPFTIDAVLIYAQRGHGRRASLYSDYTFAIWKDDQLVPIAKAYTGLTDAEIRKIDAFVRKHTKEKFGPVRSVSPELVFELAFENIRRSGRHKSGVAVRFPRISRWRHDKSAAQADRLSTILDLLDDE